MADIFLHINNAQHGPYTEQQLQAWLRDGTVVASTLAWREGMADWQPLSAWGLGPTAIRPQAAMRPQRPQPYNPQGSGYVTSSAVLGFNRVQYFGTWVLTNILVWGIIFAIGFFMAGAQQAGTMDAKAMETGATYLGIGTIAAAVFLSLFAIWLGVKRLQNIGWHGAWILLALFPLTTPFIALGLMALPPGYAQSKKLDGAFWAWCVLFLLLVGGIVAVFVILGNTMLVDLRGKLPPPTAPSP